MFNAGGIIISANGKVIGTAESLSVEVSPADRAALTFPKESSVSMSLAKPKKLSPTLRRMFKDVRIGRDLYT